jgi:prepilin-type N-terminal cleavage/methylation domain-containing protein
MKKGFTLLELIVVIVIIGILATLGYNQYRRMAEKMRTSELIATVGLMRKSTINYYLEKGSLSSITNGDIGIGTSSGDIPSNCVSTHYYRYRVDTWGSATTVNLVGQRCTAGGKPPQGNSAWDLYITYNVATDNSAWHCGGTGECQDILP